MIEVLNDKSDYVEGLESYAHIARSFNDIASATIMTDVGKVVVGFAIVFTYVVFMLGDMDMVHNRVRKRQNVF